MNLSPFIPIVVGAEKNERTIEKSNFKLYETEKAE